MGFKGLHGPRNHRELKKPLYILQGILLESGGAWGRGGFLHCFFVFLFLLEMLTLLFYKLHFLVFVIMKSDREQMQWIWDCTVLTQSRHRVKTSLPIAIHQLSLLGARVGLAGALDGLGMLVQVCGLFAINGFVVELILIRLHFIFLNSSN